MGGGGRGGKERGKGNADKSFYSLHTQIPWLRDGSRQIRGCWVEWKLCCSCWGGWLCCPGMLTHMWKNKGMIPCPEPRHLAPSAPVECVAYTGPQPAIQQEAHLRPKLHPGCKIRYQSLKENSLFVLHGPPFKADQSHSVPVTINCTSQSCIFK